MRKETISSEKQSVRNPRFLLCDITGNADLSMTDEEWVSSPIQCLDKAVNERPGIIIVRFGRTCIRDRLALIELCAALKRNTSVNKTPVLALLSAKHQKLIKDLNETGVDFIRCIGDVRLDSTMVRKIIQELGVCDQPGRLLAMICPFIHYIKMDSKNEMKVCGAYRNRMVLGGSRLHEICEKENHLHCEYYLNPKFDQR